jgi:hypothetical protein
MPRPDDATLIQAFGEGIEAARIEADRKWGMGRLERLTALENLDLLARFRRQEATWAETYSTCWTADFLTADLLGQLQAKAASMQRAFAALDAWASEAGHRPVAPWVWEATLQDGTIVALVEDDAAASHVIAEGRAVAVYTAREVANVIDAIPEALKLAKATWTGAKFKAPDVHRSNGEWIQDGDPIPFGDEADEQGDPPGQTSRTDLIAQTGGQPIGQLPAPEDHEKPRDLSLAGKPPPVASGQLPANWEDDFA